MYKLLLSRKQIKAFKLHNFNIYFIDSNKRTLNNLIFSAKSLQENLIAVLDRDEYYRLYFLNSKIILVDSSYKGYILLDDRGSTKELPFEYCYYDEFLKKGISSNVFSYNPYSVKDEIFDLNQNRVLWSKENSFIKMPLSDIFFETPTKKDLIFLDKDTGTPLWHFSLGEIGRWYNEFDRKWQEGEIEHFVGVANGILWVNVVQGTILGIEADTGKLKYLFTAPNKVVGNASQPHHQIPQGRLNYDAKRNMLFGFHYDVFSEIDLNEPEPQLTFYIIEECTIQQAFSPNVDRYCYDEHYFYYLDAFNGKIGVIDRETKKLIWVYSFPEASTSGILMRIEVSENHLFVLDSGGTLHIFEREG